MKQKLFSILALLLMAATGAWAKDYYAPSADEVIILKNVYDASKSGYSKHSAIAWGGPASASSKPAGDPNNGGESTASNVNCYSVKGNGLGKNITLSITGVSKVIVYHESKSTRYIELRDGSKDGNIIGSGEKDTYYTEVALTATNQYSIFLHGTSDGSDDQDLYVYAIKLIAAAAPATTYSVTMAEGTEEADKWTVKVGEGEAKPFPVEGLKGGETVTATYSGEKKVKSVKAVKKAAVDPAKAYLTWDADQKKLVATEIPTTATKVESSVTNWKAGTYVVEGEVTINGTISLTGDVELIIKDGAKLTAQGISGNMNNLRIYGQAQMKGQLVVDNPGNDAINGITTFEVHSAKVTATSSGSNRGAFYYIIKAFNVYGGSVDATATGDGFGINLNGSMDIYGGEVKAVGKGTRSKSYGLMSGSTSSTVTVYGGKLWAQNADDKALKYINIEKGEGFTGKIETSDDNQSWDEYTDAETPTNKYVRVGYN